MRHAVQKLWTIEDVADFCRVKPSVVRHWVYTRSIPYIKIGKQILFEKEDLKEWIHEQKRGVISFDLAKQLKEVM